MKKHIGISLTQSAAYVIRANDRGNTVTIEDQKTILFDQQKNIFSDGFFKALNAFCDKKASIRLGISSENMMQQDFHLDANLSDDEIMSFLQEQSPQFFGHPAETLSIDYYILQKEAARQTIHVVAAQQSFIADFVAVFAQYDFSLHSIDLNECAQIRAKNYLITHPNFLLNPVMQTAWGLCL